jgi:hypothetical protein
MADAVIDYLSRFFEGLLDGDDILSVRGLTFDPTRDNAGLIGGEWAVTGSNLGDAYDYRIEYTLEIIYD